MTDSAHSKSQARAIYPLRHCEERSDEAIQLRAGRRAGRCALPIALFAGALSRAAGLLRFARNDAERLARVSAIALAVGFSTQALAQDKQKGAGAPPPTTGAAPSTSSNAPPNALQGFSQNRDKPIAIDAARLEVRDKDKVALFFGDAKADVKVVQGDTTMRSKELVVFYEQDQPKAGATKTAKAATPGPGGSSQIKRLEAKGNVIVTQKDQTVTGDMGVFDMKTNTVTMSGGVIMTQNDNVIRGDKLVVDMTTGVSKVEVNRGGRVNAIIKSSSAPKDGASPKPSSPTQLFGGKK